MRFKGLSPKTLTTPVGDVSLRRRYYVCEHCRAARLPWDEWAGLGDDHLTPHARRMAVLAGGSWSFDVASARLWELCGVRISDAVIRKVTNAAGVRAAQWQKQATGKVRTAIGNAEFYTDGASVNTWEGWKEIRLGVFAARPAGESASPAEWKTRELPRPSARLAIAGLQSADEFAARWGEYIGLLGWDDGRPVTAIADAARWIWKRVAEHLPRGECVLDVFHVSEHLHACGKVLHGEHSAEAREWSERRLEELIAGGPIRFLESLEQERAGLRGGSKAVQAKRKALTSLSDYLRPHVDGLWYASRLARGLPIGSGLVEGAAKTIIGRRLKLNSCRWLPARAENMAALCCVLYNDQWQEFWNAA